MSNVKSAKELVAAAGADVETLSADDAVKLMANSSVAFVDIRETDELQKTGILKGAVHAPRGLFEFYTDPNSPNHVRALGSGKQLVLYCSSGNRSALAAKTLTSMGITKVSHVAGGFPTLQEAGGKTEI